jgi:hypothetical protein
VIAYIASILPQPVHVEKIKTQPFETPSIDFEAKDTLPDNLVISQWNLTWIEVEYGTYNNLKKWGYTFSQKFDTQVVIINSLYDFGYHYFALYQSGKKLRELAVQGIGDGFVEDGWDSSKDPISSARKDVEIGLKENFGMYPRLLIEDEDGFDYTQTEYWLNEYCKQLGFELFDSDSDVYDHLNEMTVDKLKVYSGQTLDRVRKEKEAFNRDNRFSSRDDLPF